MGTRVVMTQTNKLLHVYYLHIKNVVWESGVGEHFDAAVIDYFRKKIEHPG